MVSVVWWGPARSPSAVVLLGAPAWRARRFGGQRSPDLLAFFWFLLLLAGRRGGRHPLGGATREELEVGTQGRAGLAASAGAEEEDGCGKTVVLEREGARCARSSAEVPLLAADGLCSDLQGRRYPQAERTLSCIMASEEDVKQRQIVEDRARNISHNVRCTECGSQSIEDSQADVAVLLRRLIRDEIKSGKSDKEIYKKLEDDFGETVLYVPKFDLQTAAIWLSPVIVGGVAAGMCAYQKHRQRTNVHIMALNLVRGVPLTPREKETMMDILTPPPPPRRWWWPAK